jgi:hypothetical protein
MVRISLLPSAVSPLLIKILHLIVWCSYLLSGSYIDCGFFMRRQINIPV